MFKHVIAFLVHNCNSFIFQIKIEFCNVRYSSNIMQNLASRSFNDNMFILLTSLYLLEESNKISTMYVFESRHEKSYLSSSRLGPTQTGLYNHRRW